jgi:hypothetical protein
MLWEVFLTSKVLIFYPGISRLHNVKKMFRIKKTFSYTTFGKADKLKFYVTDDRLKMTEFFLLFVFFYYFRRRFVAGYNLDSKQV